MPFALSSLGSVLATRYLLTSVNQTWRANAEHKDPPGIGEAEDRYHQALALAEELGMRPLIAQCHLGLGRLYRRTDNLEQAKRHLTTATSMMREMKMGMWLEQAEAELKGLG